MTLEHAVNEAEKRPQIGVGVIVIKEGKVLLGRRKRASGKGPWHFPGGKLEFGENPLECAVREAFEETGVTIKDPKIGYFTNNVFSELIDGDLQHWLTIFVVADYDRGVVGTREPKKAGKWSWFEWDNLPQPLFTPCQTLVKTGFRPDRFVPITFSTNE